MGKVVITKPNTDSDRSASDPTDPAAGPPMAKRLTPVRPSTTGFVLIDPSHNPLAFNPEAVQILCYPDKPADAGRLGEFLAGRIRSRLLNRAPHDYRSPFVSRFKSGRRLYFCRTFELSPTSEGSSPPTLGLLLERNSSEVMSPSEVAEQFHLSAREQEAVEFLLSGLTSKEIADRMKISLSTVKAFLRVVMIKIGLSTRPSRWDTVLFYALALLSLVWAIIHILRLVRS